MELCGSRVFNNLTGMEFYLAQKIHRDVLCKNNGNKDSFLTETIASPPIFATMSATGYDIFMT